MNKKLLTVMACAALLAAAQSIALAQGVTRIKARLASVNGDVITLQPLLLPPMKSPAPSDHPNQLDDTERLVTLMPETRYVLSEKSSFGAIKVGDYAGAAVTAGRGGRLLANDIYLYAPPLRGTGEGRFADNGRLLVNGTVTKTQPISADDKAGGTLTLHYRGATLDPVAKGEAVCEGRAVPAPYASALSCEAEAVVEVVPGTPIFALTMGDRGLLVPGATVTVTISRVGGRDVAPGIIVEQTITAEKPHFSP